MKRIIDYVKAIKGATSPYKIVNSDSQSKTERDVTGSTIYTVRQVHYFDDGVSVEYEREHDDGAPYPGCQEFWYTYKVVNPNGFEFEGETTKLFKSNSEIEKWLKSNG
ncbi:hypothetical protein [Moorena sp. SIO4G3]|uniref:hypothetical protein n=1 Tax=Moorena sp. SIO4G3 TaxID=2607821 RepID=UPI001428E76D|nr:hypothetical protein [Moorena sp. SIO4G3]NEO76454.1 hypothetical protein [Moorena sp. SIO4G3]